MAAIISRLLIAIVKLYQVTIARLIVPCCRFHPSCSQYMIDAIRKKGPIKGAMMGLVRILKCHPFHPGGYDPVEQEHGDA